MNEKWTVKMLIKLERYDWGGRKIPTERNNHFSSSFLEWVNFNAKIKNKWTKKVNFRSASDAYDISCCEKWRKFISLTPSTVVNDAHDVVVAFIIWLACWLLCHCLWLLWMTFWTTYNKRNKLINLLAHPE